MIDPDKKSKAGMTVLIALILVVCIGILALATNCEQVRESRAGWHD